MNHLTTEQILELVDNHTDAMSVAHLPHCDACFEKFKAFQRLDADLKTMEIPEVSSGFALRVTAKVRQRETKRVFLKPEFRIFRWALALSAVILTGALFFYASENFVTLPRLTLPGGGYYFLFGVSLLLVLALDKTLSRLQK